MLSDDILLYNQKVYVIIFIFALSFKEQQTKILMFCYFMSHELHMCVCVFVRV